MDLFSISQLSRFSGIKPHTIRMWEQRYEALTPIRSEGNTRYYDNNQLRRLLNIVSLIKADYRVSEVSSLPDKKLFKLIEELSGRDLKKDMLEYFILQLISAGMNYDEVNFEKMFSHVFITFGMKDTYVDIIYPMLKRVGIMWTTDQVQPSAEHFISNMIRQKLFTVIDSLPSPKLTSDSWLLFLPEDEFHEIGLLFSHFMIRQSGRKSVYLGANVPLESLKNAAIICVPGNLLFFVSHNENKRVLQDYIDELGRFFKNKKIWIAGQAELFENIEVSENVNLLFSVDKLERILFK